MMIFNYYIKYLDLLRKYKIKHIKMNGKLYKKNTEEEDQSDENKEELEEEFEEESEEN